jgi:hypothetical protein
MMPPKEASLFEGGQLPSSIAISIREKFTPGSRSSIANKVKRFANVDRRDPE